MFKRILVPYDGSDCARGALSSAVRLARQFEGRVRLVHVVEELAYLTGYDPYGAYSGELIRMTREAGERLLREGQALAQGEGVDTEIQLHDTLGARLGETVADDARRWNADLVVVGTHGRRGVSRLLLGSGAEQILRLAPVPVLVIRGGAATGS